MRHLRFPLLLWLAFVLLAVPAAGAAVESVAVDINSAGLPEISALPQMTPKLAEAVIAWRSKHGPYKEPKAILEVPGITEEIWKAIESRVRALPPVEADPGPPVEDSSNPGIIAIANYFIEFEGLDLLVLTPEARQAFLDTVNSEMCDCGCPGDTMARCYVNDPGCESARNRVRTIYDFVLEHSKKNPEPAPEP